MNTVTENLNLKWANYIADELVKCGVRICSMSSGSRNSLLVAAFARHELIETIVHFDERGSAFYALGRARASGQTCAWITTSGTAVANGFPAVVEASNANVPLLLLTADRPPELRDAGANQTIDQVKIFGDNVRWFADLPCPSSEIPLEYLLTTIDQAVHRTRVAPSGPVHLNVMFRDPLITGDQMFSSIESLPDRPEKIERPYTLYSESKSSVSLEKIINVVRSIEKAEKGLLIIGQLNSEVEKNAAKALVASLQWPVFADVTSGLRLSDTSPFSVPYYDLILISQSYFSRMAPDVVLHIGGRYTSKRLYQFLIQYRPPIYMRVDASPRRDDPAHIVTDRFQCDVFLFCDDVRFHITQIPNYKKREIYQSPTLAIGAIIDDYLSKLHIVSEPGIARAVSRLLPTGQVLYLGSSMPIRDMDMFGIHDGLSSSVLANRGASGIDGCIATAVGVADASMQPLTAIIGDIACLHDLNSLALLHRKPITVIVINNNGGGIFSFLSVSKYRDIFESHFGTPHGLYFEHAAAMFGISYRRESSCEGFEEAYFTATQSQDPTLIEVNTDREKNVRIHREIEDLIRTYLNRT